MRDSKDKKYNLMNIYNPGDWDIGLPLPTRYIGAVDLLFYRLSYYLGHHVNLIGISPNMITCCGLWLQINTAWSLHCKTNYFPLTYLMAIITDTMDGYNARRYNKQSKYGALIDHTADWISGILLFVTAFSRWYDNIYYYIIISVVMYIESYNLLYSGYVQQYNDCKDVALSTVFQNTMMNRKSLEFELQRIKEFNSSFAGIVIIILFFGLHQSTI